MAKAVEVYDGLLKRQLDEGFGKADDYLFCPHQLNRDYALRDLTRQFDQVLKAANLKEGPNGDARTLYSLRHTCIMFRLINGEGLDLLTLARSARTSVEMIDRFYAKHLTAEMNITQLQSGAKAD
jgi:integrase